MFAIGSTGLAATENARRRERRVNEIKLGIMRRGKEVSFSPENGAFYSMSLDRGKSDLMVRMLPRAEVNADESEYAMRNQM